MKTEIILRDGLFIQRRSIETTIGAQDQLLLALAKDASINVPHPFPGVDHMLVTPERIILLQKTRLPTKGMIFFLERPQDYPYLTPRLARNSQILPGDYVHRENHLNFRTIDEKTITIYFGISLVKLPVGSNTWAYGSALLFGYADKEAFYIPFPNVYDDGRCCLGITPQLATRDNPSDPKRHIAENFAGVLDLAYLAFMTHQANTDLTSPSTFDWFSINAQTGEWGKGHEQLVVLGNKSLNGLNLNDT